jgi:FemAB-related protein (PEP-CTERM system-associated)
MKISVRIFKEEDRKEWDSYVMRASGSTCYHLIGWKDVVENSFGRKPFYLIEEDGENGIIGILPLVHLKSPFFGNFMVSLPYFNYGGICADNEEISEQLLKQAISMAINKNAHHIELRHTQNTCNGLPAKMTKVSMRLELPEKSDELWNSFPSKLRSQIRKPIKEGMYSKLGKREELNSFYKVFSANMRDLGTPVYSKKFFSNILEEFPESTWICTVYTRENRPVASGFLVGFKEGLEIPWAASLKDYNQLSPNMLLYWSCLEFACGSGYKVFDFGRSAPGEGTYKFKEQWRAKPVQLYWHYWLKNGGPLPELNPDNPKYKMAIDIWRKLPVSLTRWIGPHIVKNLP